LSKPPDEISRIEQSLISTTLNWKEKGQHVEVVGDDEQKRTSKAHHIHHTDEHISMTMKKELKENAPKRFGRLRPAKAMKWIGIKPKVASQMDYIQFDRLICAKEVQNIIRRTKEQLSQSEHKDSTPSSSKKCTPVGGDVPPLFFAPTPAPIPLPKPIMIKGVPLRGPAPSSLPEVITSGSALPPISKLVTSGLIGVNLS
jgi:hypothetical protein